MIPLICANCLGDCKTFPDSKLACHYCAGTGTVWVEPSPIVEAAIEEFQERYKRQHPDFARRFKH